MFPGTRAASTKTLKEKSDRIDLCLKRSSWLMCGNCLRRKPQKTELQMESDLVVKAREDVIMPWSVNGWLQILGEVQKLSISI